MLHREELNTALEHRREGWAYAHPRYAEALSEFGTLRRLPRSGGFLLERRVPGSDARDAMGCYPLFSCTDWTRLSADLDELRGEVVSATLVADPFAPISVLELERIFDVVRPMKHHYIVDLAKPLERVASRHHRRAAWRALRQLEVSLCEDPSGLVDEWNHLYRGLVERKEIKGIRAFSRDSFAAQFEVPGSHVFVAHHGGELVAVDWYFLDGDVTYAHLAAASQRGYELGAAYALQWYALERLCEQTTWVDLGGAVGLTDDEQGGLAFFKRGWASHVSPVYLCGRILDPDRYTQLKAARVRTRTTDSYFPAYRVGEFG